MQIRSIWISFMVFAGCGHLRSLYLILPPYRGKGFTSVGRLQRSRMRPRQKAHGRSLSTKGVTQKTKEDLEGLSTALPKRTDILFEQFAAVLADPIRGEASPPSVLSHVWSFLKERCKPGSPAGTSLVISISGGVDSMVLSHCMIILRNQWGLNLSAVHIDYNIRPSSQAEAAFVETWARKVALPLTMVRLNSTESLNLSRTAFEDFSRRARYEAYEKVMQNRAMAVLTGHHVDDAAENVLSNLFMGRSLFHIPVMGPEAFIERVRIWRPFFSLPKRTIYAFAHAHEIPYLKNIDAPSGRRAVLHGSVIPTLEDAFGRRTIQNIARVGQSAKDWKEIIDQQILTPLWRKVDIYPHGAIVPFDEFPLLEAFWEEAFVGIFHAMGCSMLSKPSIAQLVSALHSEKSRWLPIHKQFDLFVDTKKRQILIVNSKLFPGPDEMGCWKMSSSEETGAYSANSVVGLLNGYVTIPNKHSRHSLEELQLPAEVAARLPSPETIRSSDGFTEAKALLDSSHMCNVTFQLTAKMPKPVRYPCDVSRVVPK
ncbi:unnamed protein product, partial [Cladocopium goreaui]